MAEARLLFSPVCIQCLVAALRLLPATFHSRISENLSLKPGNDNEDGDLIQARGQVSVRDAFWAEAGIKTQPVPQMAGLSLGGGGRGSSCNLAELHPRSGHKGVSWTRKKTENKPGRHVEAMPVLPAPRGVAGGQCQEMWQEEERSNNKGCRSPPICSVLMSEPRSS